MDSKSKIRNGDVQDPLRKVLNLIEEASRIKSARLQVSSLSVNDEALIRLTDEQNLHCHQYLNQELSKRLHQLDELVKTLYTPPISNPQMEARRAYLRDHGIKC